MNNPTSGTVSVPRELLERLSAGGIGIEDYNKRWGAVDELRAILAQAALAAPLQPVCHACKDTGRLREPGNEEGDCSACLERHASVQSEEEPVDWSSPKTVKQLIRQLQTLDPDLETVALYRLPDGLGELSGKVKQGHISISNERMDGVWLGPYKGDGRMVLAFWTKLDPRDEPDGDYVIGAKPTRAARMPNASRFDLESPDGPEQFLKNLFKVHIGRNDFDAYIHAHLASDFAYVLSKWIAEFSAPATQQ